MMRILVLLLVLMDAARTMSNILVNRGEDEYCEFETLKADCGPDEVIMMTHAKYGRMKLGRCVQADLGFVGCSSDVLDLADKLCSGRRTCEIPVPNKEMKTRKMGIQQQSCFKELTSYLEASYRCAKVMPINTGQCLSCDYVHVTDLSGTLASVLSKESACGTTQCPWKITVPTGQRINITLVNFAWLPGSQRRITSPYEANCQVLATIRENARAKPKTVCSTPVKESLIYTSLTNSVEIRITPNRMSGHDPIYFLFKYEAVGCPDPEIPTAGWVERKSNTATLGCNDSSTSVTWKCSSEGAWHGDRLVCQAEAPSAVVGYVQVGGLSLSFGLSITVIVVLAIVIGLVILFIGLVVFKRMRRLRHIEEPIYQPPPYMSGSYTDPPPSYDKAPMAPKSTTLTLKPKSSQRCVLATQQQNQLQQQPREENGYTHIWQRPLPDKPPEDHMLMHHIHHHQIQPANYEQHPGPVHYGYNSIESVPLNQCNRKNSNQYRGGRGANHKRVVSGGNNVNSPNAENSNFMAALKENRTGPAHTTRYFPLDIDRSNHVSA